jgi:hypothetical protein
LIVHYPWHPLHGQQVSVVRIFRKGGIETCRCVHANRNGLPAVELPSWMLDRACCAPMHLSDQPAVNLAALLALRHLLHESTRSPVADSCRDLQSESQPQIGDHHDNQKQIPAPASRSVRSRITARSAMENTASPHPRGTPPNIAGDVAQSSGPRIEPADSKRRRS